MLRMSTQDSIDNMVFDFNSHTHRRFNPLLNSWVMVAPHRTQRPWHGAQEAEGDGNLPTYDPQCYLCPGNKRAKGNVNPKYTTTFIFENDYAAVKQDQPDLVLTPVNEEGIKNGGDHIFPTRLICR
jgi:UDPglucose--hexose-1-phosphate uridylyltransferase